MSKAKKTHPLDPSAGLNESQSGGAGPTGTEVGANTNGTAEAWTEETPSLEEPARPEAGPWRDELAQSQDRLLRLRAEFDNYRRRTLQDALRVREQAVDRVVLALLPALDDLERVSAQAATGAADPEALRRGVDLVLAKFHAQLEQVDVRVFESKGQPFDPLQHEALTTRQDPAQSEDVVLDELVRGYRRGEAVIRHAQVVVNKP
ncbi:MAG: nucleotide exchange factor GrpE [Candidatus Delongbacteria bacterium]